MQLIHFTADWCQPCKMMKPIIGEVIFGRNDIEYIVSDIDKDPEFAKQHGVMGVPTFIILEEGVEVSRVVGAKPKTQFIKELGI